MDSSNDMERYLLSCDPSLVIGLSQLVFINNKRKSESKFTKERSPNMPTWLSNVWNAITGGTTNPVVVAMEGMVTQTGDLIAAVLPVGVGLMFVMAIPRIIRRVVNTFL